MKRHPALQDLSRDHFHVLFRLQRFRRHLARRAPWVELSPLVEEFLAFFGSDLSPHFREEDEIVAPAALGAGDDALRRFAEEVVSEHVVLRSLVADLARVRMLENESRALLARLEPILTRHVHQEEGDLFEGLQRLLPEPALAALGAASAAFRAAHRAPDASGPRRGRG